MQVRSQFPPDKAWLFYEWCEGVLDTVVDDSVPKDAKGFVEAHLQILTAPATRSWAIEEGGELVGCIWTTFTPERIWIAPTHCIFAPEVRGKGIAETAGRFVFEQLFNTGVRKITFTFMATNRGVASLVRKFGADRDAALPMQSLSNGQLVSVEIWSLRR